jgi:hypothetical protein
MKISDLHHPMEARRRAALKPEISVDLSSASGIGGRNLHATVRPAEPTQAGCPPLIFLEGLRTGKRSEAELATRVGTARYVTLFV